MYTHPASANGERINYSIETANFSETAHKANTQLPQEIGRVGLKSDIQLDILHTPLPEGYQYSYSGSIKPDEVSKLFRKVEIGEDIDDDYMQIRDEQIQLQNLEALDVGVRDRDGTLVGFGSIIYREKQGELSDFVVDPEHQSKGIGKSIINERLGIAALAGIESLYVRLEPTNKLKPYYLENGFQETTPGGLERGPDPICFSLKNTQPLNREIAA